MTTSRSPGTLTRYQGDLKDQTYRKRARVAKELARDSKKGKPDKGSSERTIRSLLARFPKGPRTINRDECRRHFLRLLRGGGGPRPREILSAPNSQEGAASPLHQVGWGRRTEMGTAH